MTRKEILIFQLREIRNEFQKALTGLDAAALTSTPIPGRRNSIGWIVCHCMRTMDRFVHTMQTGKPCAEVHPHLAPYIEHGSRDPGEDNPLPDYSGVAAAWGELQSACIGLIEKLSEEDLDGVAPHWSGRKPEIVAANCVRMINHKNAHLRQIWMLRGAMGETEHFPHQTLRKKPEDPRGAFHAPEE